VRPAEVSNHEAEGAAIEGRQRICVEELAVPKKRRAGCTILKIEKREKTKGGGKKKKRGAQSFEKNCPGKT